MIQTAVNWLKKQSLIQQGLRCGRDRKQADENPMAYFFECSHLVRAAVFAFAIFATARVALWHSTGSLSEVTMVSMLLWGIGVLFLALLAREVWHSNKLLILIVGCFVANFLINKALFVVLDSPGGFDLGIPTDLFVPAVLGPMLATILISSQAGVFLVLLLTVSNSVFIEGHDSLLVSSLLTGFAGVYFTRHIRRRSNLLAAGAGVGLVGLGCTILQGGIGQLSMAMFLINGLWAVFLGIIGVFVVGAVLPVLEWLFDRITDISWLELTDLNHPLLKRLTMEAPGTYHHCLMVGHLAEAAARVVDANPTMCRVLAYFHDIGKLTKPNYFIENVPVDENPHEDLSPSMSALIIIAHVKEGIDRVLKYGLPKPIVDTIQQHHGTSLVYYFYRKALQQQEDARIGSEILKLRKQDAPEVKEESFRYPGPIPQFRECAIVGLADAIESGSRNLSHPTPQSIETLVNEIINKRIEERQLDDSQLTLQEIRKLAESFIFSVKNMLHTRIAYPSAKEKSEQQEKENGRSSQSPRSLPLVDLPTPKTS